MNYNNQIELDFSNQISLAANEKKTLNKPFRTANGPKKFSVYVKNEKGNVVKVNFGDPNMEIKRDDPVRRKSYRARHQCDSKPGPKWKANYWSCKMWESGKSVTQYTKGSLDNYQENWDGETFWDKDELLKIWPDLSKAQEVEDDSEELDEYKGDFLGMSIGSLRSIQAHVTAILNNIEDSNVKENLTESWLQGKIAITEDYVTTIHNYVMFNKEDEYSNANDNGEMQDEEDDYENGAMVKNVNPSCDHYGSEGIVQSVEDLPNKMGKVVKYKVTNDGATYKVGDVLTKTKDQLRKYDPKKFNPSTLSPEVLKKLKKITEQINPEEKEHGGGNGFSEDEKEYQKRYDQVQW